MQPSHREVFNLTEDRPDPRGGDRRGVEVGHDLTAGAIGHPLVWTPYTNKGIQIVLEVDVYDDHLHLHCPMCFMAGREVGLMIRRGEKAYEYDPNAKPPLWPGWVPEQLAVSYPQGVGGRLHVEPFRCTWENPGSNTRDFGLRQCEWHVSIMNNRMVPA
jgi:hypothetical protein